MAMDGEMTSNEQSEVGKQLRREIIDAFQELNRKKALNPAGNDISELVSRYIPTGMPFESADLILTAAGFDTAPLPPRKPPENPPSWYKEEDSFSLVGRAVLDSAPFYKVMSVVTAFPDALDITSPQVKRVEGIVRLATT